jgi:hypothetical protein
MKEYDVVLKEKEGVEGLILDEIEDMMALVKDPEVFPIDLEAREHECAAMGFITTEAADCLDYDYEGSGFHDFVASILDDMENETETGEYEYTYRENTISIFMSR